MARVVNALTIFISCPSDLQAEKSVVDRVVDAVNHAIRATSNVAFEVWSWERHAMLGVGISAQRVIDDQIPSHDVYLGMMWKKFGTATGSSGSGTEHEFKASLESHRKEASPKHVIFMFKTAIDSLDELNAVEFLKINEFKTRIGDEGVMHGKFGDIAEFERVLQMNLTRIALAWKPDLNYIVTPVEKADRTDSTPRAGSEAIDETISGSDEDGDELGLFDYIEISEQGMTEANLLVHQITSALTGMGGSLSQRADAMALARKENDVVPVKLAKLLTNQAADDMLRFTELANPLIAAAEAKFEEAIEAMLAALATQDSSEGWGDLGTSVESMIQALDSADAQMVDLHLQILSLPKLSIRFNKARRNLLGFVDGYSRMSLKIRSLAENVLRNIQPFGDSTVIDV